MKENKSRSNISIRSLIFILFVVAMLISLSGIGMLIFKSWISSAKNTMELIAEDMNQKIYAQIYSFICIPEQINEVNHQFIEKDIVNFSDAKVRDKFFVSVLNSYDDQIYSFSYGTKNGEYYGARRNEKGEIEIMRNNAKTLGNSWYYSVNKEGSAGNLIVDAGKFDPRTRVWYKEAEAAGKQTFSPIYKHFVMDDLTVSAAWPIYDGNRKLKGVLGTHMLLSSVGGYLQDTVRNYDGYAIIFEKKSGALIANSMGINNFIIRQDGTLKRENIHQIKNIDMRKAYEYSISHQQPNFLYKGQKENLYINTKEIHMEGLDWVLISAIPETLLITQVFQSIRIAVILSMLALVLALVMYYIAARTLLKPMTNLLHVSGALSSGDFSNRIPIVRNDEIGAISESFNKVAEKMQFLVDHLEAEVEERTEELFKTNQMLEENKNQLRLILDSTEEAIYGIDVEGKCTFCNISCITILGYSNQEELLGKDMHQKIHHSRPDYTPLSKEECKIIQAIQSGERSHSDSEVFWKADGSALEVEYNAYPQFKNGKVVGAVIAFMDLSERKKREKEIEFLSCHDTLTGLFNRSCFERNSTKVDLPKNLPISVIFADINGLKMTNDIFGHTAGDALIKKSSEILIQSCRENDILARVGGDEFIILLPNTDDEQAQEVILRIRQGFSEAHVEAIKCSIALGCDTKTSAEQVLEEMIVNAENAMYKDKTLNRKSTNNDILNTIIETLHRKSEKEKLHSFIVCELCGKIGAALNLPETSINKLKRAGYLHDIGKIVLETELLYKNDLSEEELEKKHQHSVVGYRILNLFDDTLDLAEDIYSHHEGWDGTGYPRGLKGEEISLVSRIISVAERYERELSSEEGTPLGERKQKAIRLIKEEAGRQFDPEIAELFVKMMENEE